MNGGTIRGTALSMDGTARLWLGGYHEWVTTLPSLAALCLGMDGAFIYSLYDWSR